jgi:pyrroloquinoline-quinone synthase
VAKAKIEGLAKNYAISGDRDIAFFRVHMDADVLHSQTSRDILRDLCDSPEKSGAAEHATQRTLDALYGFLDSVTAN